MSTMKLLQLQIAEWSNRNFPNDTLVDKGLGLAEEAGEVCRAILKDKQGLRGTHEQWIGELGNELGDVLIQLFLVAELADLDLEACLISRWYVIKTRDWTIDKKGHGLPNE